MRIAVIDDDPADRALLREYAQRCDATRDASLTEYENGEAFLRAYVPGAYAALFIDCYMEGVGGMALAKAVRAAHDQCALVFTTSSADFAVEGYTVRVLGYLLKPIAYPDFVRTAELLTHETPFVKLNVDRGVVRLPLCEILWCRSAAHVVEVHTAGRGVVCAQMSLEALAAQLAPHARFFSCCRGYLVNLERVEGIAESDFLLPGGQRVPIRRRGLAKARQVYADYLFDREEGRL